MVGVVRHGVLVEAKVDLGREEQQPGGTDAAIGVLEQNGVGQPAATRVTGEEDPGRGDVTADQVLVDGGRVLRAGGVGELRRQAIVGDEHRAPGLPAHPRGEERVHRRRGADVAPSVEVEDDPDGRLVARHVEDPGDAAELGRTALDVEGPHDRGHDPLADVVEHELERAELGDAQRRGVAHEGADDLPGDGDAEIGER